MRYQRGQGLIEFALVLPFLLIIIFGLFYAGMLFSDYIALNNLARQAARDASLVTSETYTDSQYDTVYDKFVNEAKSSADPKKYFLPNSLYTWDPNSNGKDGTQFYIEPSKTTSSSSSESGSSDSSSSSNNSVTVHLKAPINSTDSGLYGSLTQLFNIAQNIEVTYSMYSEYEHTTSTAD